MLYSEFKGKKLSRLGFGTMRLPLNPDGSVDEAQVAEMTRYAMEHGVNYFDTAWPYHQGKSTNILQVYQKEHHLWMNSWDCSNQHLFFQDLNNLLSRLQIPVQQLQAH